MFAFSIAPGPPVHLPGLAFVLAALLPVLGTVIAARVTVHGAPLPTAEAAPNVNASGALPHDSSH